jgi:hypothetical protein
MKTNNQFLEKLLREVDQEFDQRWGGNLWFSKRPEPHYKGEPYTYISCDMKIKDFLRSEIKNTVRETLDAVLDESYELGNEDHEWSVEKHSWVGKVVQNLTPKEKEKI